MNKIILGKTGIEVTELCFGALPIGPMQKNLPVEEAAGIIAHALQSGINFIDTAQTYQTYVQIRGAMEMSGIKPVIASKSPAHSYDAMEADIDRALRELGLESIDIFLLHGSRAGTEVFYERSEALRCLMDYREKGLIKAVGISTHDVGVVEAAAEHDGIDIVFPIINKTGIGIMNGDREMMESAIGRCFDNGRGVYIMKALGGGNLSGDYCTAMEYVRNFTAGRAPVAVGMISKAEIDFNVKYFSGESVEDLVKSIKVEKKKFIIPRPLCKACGVCIAACPNNAIQIEGGVASIDDIKCLTCGYCVGACPQFAIRMV